MVFCENSVSIIPEINKNDCKQFNEGTEDLQIILNNYNKIEVINDEVKDENISITKNQILYDGEVLCDEEPSIQSEDYTELSKQILQSIDSEGCEYTTKGIKRIRPIPIHMCMYCSEVFIGVGLLRKHCRRIHKTRIICECFTCNERFVGSLPRALHLREKHNYSGHKTSIFCKLCKTIQPNQRQMNVHFIMCSKKNKNKIKIEVNDDDQDTKMCDDDINYDELFKHRKRQNYIPQICIYCFKILSSTVQLQFHCKRVHKTRMILECYSCDSIFRNTKQLKRHLRNTHGSKDIILCKLCNCYVEGDVKMNFHLVNCMKDCKLEKVDPEMLNLQLNSDQIGDYSNDNNQSDLIDVKCEVVVNELNENEQQDKSHLELEPTNEIPNRLKICIYCLEIFNAVNQFRYHSTTVHNTSMMYECYTCDERFSTALSRRKHMHDIHDIPTHRSLMLCKFCDSYIKSEKNMNIHIIDCIKKNKLLYDSFHHQLNQDELKNNLVKVENISNEDIQPGLMTKTEMLTDDVSSNNESSNMDLNEGSIKIENDINLEQDDTLNLESSNGKFKRVKVSYHQFNQQNDDKIENTVSDDNKFELIVVKSERMDDELNENGYRDVFD